MQKLLPLLTDSALLSRYRQGDQRAFEQLVERYQSSLFRFLMGLLKNPDMAYDVTQHIWIQCAFASFPRLSSDTASLRSWLFHVARNKAIDMLRHCAREKLRTISLAAMESDTDDDAPSTLWIEDSHPGPEALTEQREMQMALFHAIATLPPIYQQIVYFRLWHQLSYRHIGHRLGMPAVTVKTYFYRSRFRLSRTLANWMETGVLSEKRDECD